MSLEARLSAFAVAVANRIKNAHGTWWQSVSTVAGRALVGAADAAAQRAALGVSNHNLVAVDSTGNVTLAAGKTVSGPGTTSGGFSLGTSVASGGAMLVGYVGSGASYCDVNAVPSDGTSQSVVRLFRGVNTTGAAYADVYVGEGSAAVNHRLFGKGGDSFLCRINGNLLVGSSVALSSDKLQVNGGLYVGGAVKFGQYTLATLPSVSAYSGYHIDVINASGGPKTCRSDGTNWKIINTNTTVS